MHSAKRLTDRGMHSLLSSFLLSFFARCRNQIDIWWRRKLRLWMLHGSKKIVTVSPSSTEWLYERPEFGGGCAQFVALSIALCIPFLVGISAFRHFVHVETCKVLPPFKASSRQRVCRPSLLCWRSGAWCKHLEYSWLKTDLHFTV